MRHIMIDLETMGVGSKAAVIAIGACEFDPLVMYDPATARKFYINVELASSLAAGMEIDASTVYWWLEREPEVIQMLLGSRSMLPMALSSLTNFILWNETEGAVLAENEDLHIWCRGINFDLTILDNAYKLTYGKAPWRYDKGRDTRTYFMAMNNYKRQPPPKHAHNALADAEWEAMEVCRAWASVYGAAKAEVAS